jgi:hypothetical protein
MQVGNRQDFELASPMISIRPVRFSPPKIVAFAVLVVALAGLSALLSYRIAVLLLLAVGFYFAYLALSSHVLLLSLFYAVEEEDG